MKLGSKEEKVGDPRKSETKPEVKWKEISEWTLFSQNWKWSLKSLKEPLQEESEFHSINN